MTTRRGIPRYGARCSCWPSCIPASNCARSVAWGRTHSRCVLSPFSALPSRCVLARCQIVRSIALPSDDVFYPMYFCPFCCRVKPVPIEDLDYILRGVYFAKAVGSSVYRSTFWVARSLRAVRRLGQLMLAICTRSIQADFICTLRSRCALDAP